MPGPDGIITVYGSFRKAKECEEGEAAFAEAVFFGEEFKEIHAATDPTEMPALQILREHQLYAKFSKCEFWLDQVEFLGHVISKEGIAVNPSKVASVLEWEAPKNVKQIRGFFGNGRILPKVYRRVL
jgi:hypothetical protein